MVYHTCPDIPLTGVVGGRTQPAPLRVQASQILLAYQAGKVSGRGGRRVRISRDGKSVDRHWVCATWIPRNGPPVVVNADRLLMHSHVSHAKQ